MRIKKMLEYLHSRPDVESVKLYDKWHDKLTDYDIIHIFKDSLDCIGLMDYAKEAGLKTVLSSVIPQMYEARIRFALAIQRIIRVQNTYSMLFRGLDLSDAIVAQTRQEADFINKIYGISRAKIHIIPNGVNETLLDRYHNTTAKDIVLCVGRFDTNKNQLSLIRALKNSGIPLHFVGGSAVNEKSYYEECRKVADHDGNIVFHGWLGNDSEELANLYERAKVVALISHKEIFGNSLIEGAASGANLVASNSIPVDEWNFGHHCLKVSPTSIEEIRHGVLNAWSMPASSEIHEQTAKLFSWSSVVNQYVEIYKSLLK